MVALGSLPALPFSLERAWGFRRVHGALAGAMHVRQTLGTLASSTGIFAALAIVVLLRAFASLEELAQFGSTAVVGVHAVVPQSVLTVCLRWMT